MPFMLDEEGAAQIEDIQRLGNKSGVGGNREQ